MFAGYRINFTLLVAVKRGDINTDSEELLAKGGYCTGMCFLNFCSKVLSM
jgi:hypothetical protein